MPSAIKAGLTYKEAMHMTPKAIEMHIKAYTEREQEKIKVSEYLSWLNGYYVVEAIACTFGKGKYSKNPLLEEEKEERIKNNSNKEGQEEIAVFEMKQRIRLLRESGLPESPD